MKCILYGVSPSELTKDLVCLYSVYATLSTVPVKCEVSIPCLRAVLVLEQHGHHRPELLTLRLYTILQEHCE